MGVICPIGNTPEEVWTALSTGQSGVAPLSSFSPEGLPVGFAAEARQFTGDIADFGPLEGDLKKAVRKGLKLMCRECQTGVAAAMRALHHAGLTEGKLEPTRSGIVFGSDYMHTQPEEFTAGMAMCTDKDLKQALNKWGGEAMRQVTPLWLLKYLPNMPACHIAIYNDLRGPNNSLTLREASSNLAIGEAYRTILRGSADVMIAGATGTRVHPMRTVQIVQQEELATNGVEPAEASRPFDASRTGMVLGEGAAAIVLEEFAAAQARGATIIGEIVGAGSSSVANRNFVANRRQALDNALRVTLRDAGLSPREVGHIHAHGLSTRSSDVEEAAAIHNVFGQENPQVPVVAAKSYFGNLGAGGGVVELVTSLLAMEHGRLFPVLNFTTPDPECPVNAVTSHDVPAGDIFLNLNVTPQGQAACIAVRRV